MLLSRSEQAADADPLAAPASGPAPATELASASGTVHEPLSPAAAPRPPRPPPGEPRELEEDEYTDHGYEELDTWDEKQLAFEERLIEYEEHLLELED